ncbi:PufQ cytochrome subunit [Rhodobacteraceae bacterium THAF1]|uniref:cytochrome PufQ n=1 Tax=Palleronia sp. THAF1 TaxID=2587842 RepID=UPI000F405B35|nr:cytochrome PufQ [Palleronia sp. THAF1]QFU09754.1 PufQ cytochrome subunit [Palleronia sp. THAF1]VDC17343.1 PufQ cytochrome subunit [Rhodobacteraceae bacterium THAF1]
MSDMTNTGFAAAERGKTGLKTEFAIYFAIIFAATVPLACLTWALTAIRSSGLPERGPIKRAWSQARIITPMIFSA